MKSDDEMDSRSEKKGMASAMTQAMMVMAAMSTVQVSHPIGVLMYRMMEFL